MGQQVGTHSTLKRGWCTHWKEHKEALSKHGGTCLCGTHKSLEISWSRLHIFRHKEAIVRKGSLSALNGDNVISNKARDLAR